MVSYWSLLVLPIFAATVRAAPMADPGVLGAVTSTVTNTASNAGNAVVNTALGTTFNAIAPLEGVCTLDHLCSINVNGSMTNLLVDGSSYTGKMNLTGWCTGGNCYGSVQTTVTTPAVMNLSCSSNSVCNGTISGAMDAIFSNGKQLILWGWLTPSGYCMNGTCTASVNALGDPAYKN